MHVPLCEIAQSLVRLSTRRRLAACGLSLLALTVVLVRGKAHDAREMAAAQHARKQGKPIPVRTTLVSHSDVVEVIGATALTAPSHTVTVITGRASDPGPKDYLVKSIHLQPGRFLPKDALLIEFDDTIFQQVLKHRQAELNAAAEVREQPGRMESRQQILDAEAAYQQARLNLELARADLESCQLRSTIGGFAGDLNLAVGDRVEFGRVLTRVEQIDPIHVVVDLPQERIKQVQIGHAAEVTLDSFPGETFLGTVVQVPACADPKTRTLGVVVEVANPDHRIKGGVTGFARLQITKNALTVPSIAAIRQGDKSMVFRVEANRARIREVQIGHVIEPGRVEILTGLSSGDEVIIYGAQYLKDNDPVNTDWEEWSGRRGS